MATLPTVGWVTDP